MLGVSGSGLFGSETTTTVNNFVDQTGITFPVLLNDNTYFQYANPDGAISPYPLDVIIDRQGQIRYLRHEFDGEAMRSTIEQLLAEE